MTARPDAPPSPQTAAGQSLGALPCSRSLSESKVEEIIATLWTILWAILFVNHAPEWMLWLTGTKAIADHLCAVRAAIREIRSENVESTRAENKS